MVNALKTIGLWLGVTFLILLAGTVWVMIGYTLVNPWVFFGCMIVISIALTGLCLRLGRLPAILGNQALNIAVCGLIVLILTSGITLSVNYFTADFKGEIPTKAIVARKYQQTRHRTRRSGRHSYERGEPYQVYMVDLRLLSDETASDTPSDKTAGIESLPGNNDKTAGIESLSGNNGKTSDEKENEGNSGKPIKIELNRKTYGRIHKGDTVTIRISRGLLHMPVISPSTLRPLHPRKSKNKSKSRLRFSPAHEGRQHR